MAVRTLTVLSKKQEGIVGQNLVSAFSAVPWLSGLGNELTATEQIESNLLLGLRNSAQFTIFPEHQKCFELGFNQTATAEHQKCFELGFNQHVICAKYPYGEQYYGVFSIYGPQLAGRTMLPLNSVTNEGTIFVNAKQYNGIIRRRQYRVKAKLETKLPRNRKPYLHAMRRPRGCGGRFLNTKKWKLSLPTRSQSSKVLQSDSEDPPIKRGK